jgi:hypothetical protein
VRGKKKLQPYMFLDKLQTSKGKWARDLKAPDIFRLGHEPGNTGIK